MPHLRDDELVDLIDGAAGHRAHVEQCERCRKAYHELIAALAAVRSDEIPEPSPLYWEHLSRQVRARVAGEPLGTSWWRLHPFAAGALLASVMTVAVVTRVWWSPRGGSPTAPPPAHTTAAATDRQETVEPEMASLVADDSSWEFLQEIGGEIPWDDAAAAGLAPSATVDYHALDHLTTDQQAELAAYLRQQIDRGKS